MCKLVEVHEREVRRQCHFPSLCPSLLLATSFECSLIMPSENYVQRTLRRCPAGRSFIENSEGPQSPVKSVYR